MKYRVEITDQVEREIESAYLWIFEDSPLASHKWFNGLLEVIDSLQSCPERCTVARESLEVGEEVRQLLYGNYRLLFCIKVDIVFLLHFRHGKRDQLTRDDF